MQRLLKRLNHAPDIEHAHFSLKLVDSPQRHVLGLRGPVVPETDEAVVDDVLREADHVLEVEVQIVGVLRNRR